MQDYLAKVPSPSFSPDADNVIPIVDGDWFEDDVVGLFRQFLRTAFGDQHFEENLEFVDRVARGEEPPGLLHHPGRKVEVLRRPRSALQEASDLLALLEPQGLVQRPDLHAPLHAVDGLDGADLPAGVRHKLESALQQAERAGNAKEADRLRKILVELNEYEHDTLYPKASENVVIDLDDGVKANYPKFGTALKKITGLEASGD